MEENNEKPIAAAEPTPSDLETRLQYLEAQNEGLKRVGALALALLLILGGLFVFQVWNDLKGIATGGLVLHDENKNSKVAMTVNSNGALALVPINQLGYAPPLEQVGGEFNGLGIYDSSGKLRIVLGTNIDDQPVVGIFGNDGKMVWSPLPQLPSGQPPKAAPNPGAKAPGATPTAAAPKTTATPVTAP